MRKKLLLNAMVPYVVKNYLQVMGLLGLAESCAASQERAWLVVVKHLIPVLSPFASLHTTHLFFTQACNIRATATTTKSFFISKNYESKVAYRYLNGKKKRMRLIS